MIQSRICIVIQSRLTSTRLPAKALLPLGGYPTVILCALRVANMGLPVIVATSNEQADDILEKILSENDISCSRGPLTNVLARFTNAVTEFDDNDWVVRLTADNVFPDGHFLNLLLNGIEDGKYDYIGASSPADGLPYGVSAEIFKVGVLREANKKASTDFDREHVTPYIKRNFRCKEFVLENAPINWKKLRCTLDTFDDYQLLLQLFKHVKEPLKISWAELVHQLELLVLQPKKEKDETQKIDLQKYRKFTLGTVQLGLSYGIANKNGLPSEIAAGNLLNKAIRAGVRTLDTARAYGLSEQRIGNALQTSKRDVKVVSKLHPLQYLPANSTEEQVRHAVRASVFETCYHLKSANIDTLLLHRWEHRYKWDGAAWDELTLLKSEGLIKNIGCSVTTPAEVIQILSEPEIVHVQCPVNLLDWRWRQSDFLEAIAKRQDVIFFARSVYLQGLLTMKANRWPSFPGIDVLKLNNTIDNWVTLFNRANRQDLCLAYVRGLSWISSLVLGMETEIQLQENLSLFDKPPLSQEQINHINQAMLPLPESFLNPAQWTL